ncbi:DNA repair helicase XPB [Kroppenstedtia eburnea]|uniref:DNA 3'-5' helicase n=1 Tax=Kroppenstedtia eburnea TaxID=714067 RepID=A0A1N7KHG2_9BACL|nr:DNA repair helicase XPB [Kroppenstedtia eburnea]QKI82983.1 DEAD/DEAH box helicase [Kroppenstedtia eburnea]SIS61025.1 DNA excision repair protein ERCC-3 [Kroppenstedtia eburnea]
MIFRRECPLIVQADRTVLLEVDHPSFQRVRDQLSGFAELVKSPDLLHTYRITPLSLWNAAAAGTEAEEIISFLEEESKFGLPASLKKEVEETMARYGLLKLEAADQGLILSVKDASLFQRLKELYPAEDRLVPLPGQRFRVPSRFRGLLKRELIRWGYPVEDVAGFTGGEVLDIRLRERTAGEGNPFHLRTYQKRAVESFYREGDATGGSGVLVLPCGAGKTVIGMAVMEKVGRATLILTPNTTSVRQWIRELLDKTCLTESEVGEYTGKAKEVRPVTVATYQIITNRDREKAALHHMMLFGKRDWGLVIYDEVHLLPAPVFRATADIQARRRLGLTATLIREDGREADVFSLIGPKKFEVSWREMEEEGWIAKAVCTEIRTGMDDRRRREYEQAAPKNKYRIAAENPEKLSILKEVLERHREGRVLVIGQYLSQLREAAAQLKAPLITGETAEGEREKLYERFRQGKERVLVVSKVANFAVDLPDASVAVQLSGTFGSRQEEAQRLGRILRPKKEENEAYFYTIVSRDTLDQEYARNRQLFLMERGYRYAVADEEAWGESR